MPKVLFVDDMEERWRSLIMRVPEPMRGEFRWAKDVKQAQARLKMQTFNVVCLDHDLTEQNYYQQCSEGSGCGCDLVKFLSLEPWKYVHMKFIIHSWNPAGAESMHRALDECGLDSIVKAFS